MKVSAGGKRDGEPSNLPFGEYHMGLLSIFRKRKWVGFEQEGRNFFSASRGSLGRRSQKVNVGQLSVGMYVSRLDRPWLETPFAMQGFYIRRQEDIDKVGKYCDHVYIDVLRESDPSLNASRLKERAMPIHKLPDKAAWLEEEKKYLHSLTLTKSILEDVRFSGIVKDKSIRDTVCRCVESILQNSHTLLWVSQLSSRGSKGLERHAMSVCVISIAFGRYMGFDRKELEKLGMSALLHDIGMVHLNDEVRNRIYNGLSEFNSSELGHVRSHTDTGRDLLVASEWLMSAIDVAYCHHENYDGSGYPRGLKGHAIPELAQIVSLADTYDAITNAESYQSNKSSLDALKIIYDQRDRKFDSNLALSFIRFITIYPPGAIVELKNGMIGIVIDASAGHKHLPKIMLLLDANQQAIKPTLVDLDRKHKQSDGQTFGIVSMYPPGSFDIDTRKYLDPRKTG